MEETSDAKPHTGRDFGTVLDRMERTYLAALRALALVIATLLLIYAAWLGVTGLYQVSRKPNSIKEAPAVVATDEITAIDLKSTKNGQQKAPDPFRTERAFYQQFGKDYLGLYRSKFEAFQQKGDAKVASQQFNDAYVRVDERLDAIKQGDIEFAKDKADLEALLKGMRNAASVKVTQERLEGYRRAKKTKVTRTVTDTRSERYCSYYGYYIDSCISWSTREVPVRRTVTEMRLPDGVVAPPNLFDAYHEKFVSTLGAHRAENAAKAQNEREEIARGNIVGSASLWTAVKVIGSFVVVMFLFLVIALERHQRRIARTQCFAD